VAIHQMLAAVTLTHVAVERRHLRRHHSAVNHLLLLLLAHIPGYETARVCMCGRLGWSKLAPSVRLISA